MDLRPATAGKTLWRYVADTDADGKPLAVPGSLAAPTWQSLYVMHWDKKYAYWFRLNPEESHLVLDSQTGKLLREQSLIRNVDYRQWDPAEQHDITHTNVNLREIRDLAPRNQMKPQRGDSGDARVALQHRSQRIPLLSDYDGALGQAQNKPLPSPGVPVPEADARQLKAGAGSPWRKA